MKKITDFFWFCSGAHIETLKKYPTEHNKYVGIGATIFFTALFASLSGGYAMYFVFSGSNAAVLFAMLFGIIWGLAIFNMDRYIVASIKKTGGSNQQIYQALPRILLAIMIGIVISRPLELKIFDKEIRQKLKTSYLNGQRSKIDTLNRAFSDKYSIELAKFEELKSEKDSLEKDINRSRYILNQEVFGDKTNQTSGVTGFGTYAKQKQAVIDQKEARLIQVRNDIQRIDDIINRRKEMEGLNSTLLFNEKQLDSLANVAGFADRNYALGQLSFNPDGSRDVDTYLAISFISFLFVLLECLPVFVKLMSDKGPYDVALQNIESVAIHNSEKEKDHEIIVTDNTLDTLNNAEIDKKKILIERRVKKDLEDFS
ncbi:DUF4407 domain-containing protein [Pedobacter puniceum]|jgi:hypothetical protein|uniref:DUF4407 domain-containing protein n=1 Tax=Pedobacter puniceum TaxID=2666136 RepID=A0A7K0FQ09_9SPHI|nr:DUF4407 domain-containing protein [Pedobacter puniceum]MRX47545.1 DUF4407 domain-containing protein [Pedobacter puniceum]